MMKKSDVLSCLISVNDLIELTSILSSEEKDKIEKAVFVASKCVSESKHTEFHVDGEIDEEEKMNG